MYLYTHAFLWLYFRIIYVCIYIYIYTRIYYVDNYRFWSSMFPNKKLPMAHIPILGDGHQSSHRGSYTNHISKCGEFLMMVGWMTIVHTPCLVHAEFKPQMLRCYTGCPLGRNLPWDTELWEMLLQLKLFSSFGFLEFPWVPLGRGLNQDGLLVWFRLSLAIDRQGCCDIKPPFLRCTKIPKVYGLEDLPNLLAESRHCRLDHSSWCFWCQRQYEAMRVLIKLGWGGMGWGVITFFSTSTTWYVLWHFHTYVMLRRWAFSCTSTHTSCYPAGRSLALPQQPRTTLCLKQGRSKQV